MIIVIIVLTLAVALVATLAVASHLLVVCGPRELLVIAGRGAAPGQGYSVLRGGRMMRLPGFQRVFRLPLGVFEVPFAVRTCDQSHVPVTLSGVAAFRISDDDRAVARAATRLLTLDEATLTRMTERIVCASVAGVAPLVDAVQLVEEPRFTQERMVLEIETRAETLGLVLDTLRIEDVKDDVGYIEARQKVRRARR